MLLLVLILAPQRLWPHVAILGRVQATGIAEGQLVRLVFAPKGRAIGAAVLAHLRVPASMRGPEGVWIESRHAA